MKLLLTLALIFLALPLLAAHKHKKEQTQPVPKRVAEIQQALADHGFPSGKDWKETREICRHIADDHGWQNMWAPDPRVLVLLGLAPSLDPEIANTKPTDIDGDERKWIEDNGGERARKAQ